MLKVLVAELLFKVISYLSTFFLNNKKRKKCRTKRKKCRTKGKNVDFFKISIRYFYLIAKKGKNVKQKGKNVDFSKILFDIFVFNIFSQTHEKMSNTKLLNCSTFFPFFVIEEKMSNRNFEKSTFSPFFRHFFLFLLLSKNIEQRFCKSQHFFLLFDIISFQFDIFSFVCY